jgi:hypothetical protein
MALMGVSRRDLSFDIFRDRRCLGSNLNLRARVARLAHAHDVRLFRVGAYFTRDPQPLKDPRASTVILIFVSSKPFLV